MDHAAGQTNGSMEYVERVLELQGDAEICSFVSELITTRQLSLLIKNLNESVQYGDPMTRASAIEALKRLGFWVE